MKKFYFAVFILLAAISPASLCKKKQTETIIQEELAEKSPEAKPLERKIADEAVKMPPGKESLIKGKFMASKWENLAPEVKDILNKAIIAVGGERATNKLQSYYYESGGEIYGFPYKAKCLWKSPAAFRMEVDNGVVFVKYGDSAAVDYNGMTFDVIREDRELTGISLFARYLATLTPFREGKMQIEYWGEGELFKKRVHKFKLRVDFAENPLFAYFDAKSHLLYAVEYSVWNRYRTRRFVEVFDNYREVGGVQVPFGRTVRSDGAVILSETIASFEFREIEDEVFKMTLTGGAKTREGFYLREMPEEVVAFSVIKGHYGNVVEGANALVKQIVAAGEVMDSVPFATHMFSDQFFSPSGLLEFVAIKSPLDTKDQENYESEVRIPVAIAALQRDHKWVKKIPRSLNLCGLFSGEPMESFAHFKEIEAVVKEKGYRINGNPILILFKDPLYSNRFTDREKTYEACYPVVKIRE